MNIGTLTGTIELEDLLSGVLMKVDAKLKAVEENAARSMAAAGGNMLLAVTAGNLLATALTTVADKSVGFAKEIITNSVMAGAELERLTKVSQFLGERLGYSKTYVDELSKSIEKSGITGQEARNALVQLENAHVDLAKASELSAAAQNMAVISGRGSSETYGMIIHAITTLNPMMIRNAGFTFTMDKVLSDYERTTGKTTATMGMHEKQGLLVNAMLKEAADKQGLYNEALQTSAKQLTSAQRAWTQVSEQIGTALLPVTDALTKAWYELATSVRDSAVSSQGAVKGFITSVADATVTVINDVTDFTKVAIEKGKELYDLYYSIPPVLRDWSKAAGEAALGLWAINAAITALATSSAVKWLVRIAAGEGIVAGLVPIAATTAAVGTIYFMDKALTKSYDSWQKLLSLKPQIMSLMFGDRTIKDVWNSFGDPKMGAPLNLPNKANPLKNNMQPFSVLPDEAKLAAGRAAMAALDAYLEHQQELQAEVTKAVMATTDAIRKQGNETEVLNKAFEQTAETVRTTKEAWSVYKPKIEEQIRLGKTLSGELRNYYMTMSDVERKETTLGEIKLKRLGVSIQEIDALKALGVTEAELALKYGVTTTALNARISALQMNKSLVDQLTDMESKLNDSLATQAQKQRDLTFENAVSKLDRTAPDYKKQVEALNAIRQGAFQTEMTNLETLKNTQLSNLQTVAMKETETYENMRRNQFNLQTGAEEYSADAIDKQREIAEAAQQAAIAVYGFWDQTLTQLPKLTHDVVDQIKSELQGLGLPRFGPIGADGNRSGLPIVPLAPTITPNSPNVTAPNPVGNPSGFASVVNPNVSNISGGDRQQVIIQANGAFFGANQRQVARTIEDMLAALATSRGL